MDESISGTAVRGWADPPIVDQFGHRWRITPREQVEIDGFPDRTTSKVRDLHYLNRQIWKYTSDRLWQSRAGLSEPWLPPEGTSIAPFGPQPDPRIDQLISLVQDISSTLNIFVANVTNALNDIKDQLDGQAETGMNEKLDLAITLLQAAGTSDRTIAAITTEITRMSGNLEDQMKRATQSLQEQQARTQTDIATVGAEVTQIKADLEAALANAPVGSQLTQEMVDAVQAAADKAGQQGAALEAITSADDGPNAGGGNVPDPNNPGGGTTDPNNPGGGTVDPNNPTPPTP